MEGVNIIGRISELLFCLTYMLSIAHGGLPLLSEPDTGQKNQTVIKGCVLGGKSYKLAEKWSLEMEESDMKYCVKCTCLPDITTEQELPKNTYADVNKVQKDNIYSTGKVSCHNIRKCPRPTCKEANESCCNSCPNLSYENKPFSKHKVTEFSALLVGSNMNSSGSTHAVAIADISVRDSSLYYSIRLTRLKPATKILFVLENDNVIHQISIGHQQLRKTCRRRCSAMMQLCGVWRKLPLLYHEYLREKQVSLVIATNERQKGVVKGLIYPSINKKKETLTSLLVAKSLRGAGGRAYFILDPTETNIDYNMKIVTGKAIRGIGRQEKITIQIGQEKKEGLIKRKSLREFIITGSWKTPEKRASRHLIRGRFSIIITSPSLGIITGKILPRIVCGSFQAVLSADMNPLYKKYQTGIGSASFQLLQNGNINYRIGVTRLDSPLRQVIIERNLISGSSGPGSNNWRRRKRNNGDLTKQYRAKGYGGWANGTFMKPKVTDLNRLLNGELYVKISTEKRRRMPLLGQIVEVPYHEQSNIFSGIPLMLVPPKPNPLKYPVKAYAWLVTGVGCHLHYQIMIQGRTTTLSEPLNAYLTNTGERIKSPHTSENTSIMGNFYDNVVSGTLTAISPHLFKALDNGNATLRIINSKYPSGILEVKVSVPNNCWKLSEDVNGIDSFLVGASDKDDHQRSKCKDNSRWYEEGETWMPSKDQICKTCSCAQGKVLCIDVLCPLLECPNPVYIKGLCCPVCPDIERKVRYSMETNNTCFFEADNRWHPVGTKWYPYLHPFGYSACAICSCKEGNGDWECEPRNCPPLSCVSGTTKFNISHCCPVCHDESHSMLATDTAQALVKPTQLRERVCTFQRVAYVSGAKWYTNVILLGEPTCGTCMCKNGKTKCNWTRCPKLKCQSLVRDDNSCCFRCLRKRGRSRKIRRKRY